MFEKKYDASQSQSVQFETLFRSKSALSKALPICILAFLFMK